MSTIDGHVLGKEQLILLPIDPKTFTLTTDPPGQVQLHSGMHAVVLSGYIGIGSESDPGFWLHDVDDEETNTLEVRTLIGPLWREVQQVSASISPGGIWSSDSDEVDNSKWVIDRCLWEVVDVEGGRRIRIDGRIHTEGEGNGWITLAYQVVATGSLMRLPTVEEISADFTN